MSPADATVAGAERGGNESRYGTDKLREGNYPTWPSAGSLGDKERRRKNFFRPIVELVGSE